MNRIAIVIQLLFVEAEVLVARSESTVVTVNVCIYIKATLQVLYLMIE